jgi:hypothetical protein
MFHNFSFRLFIIVLFRALYETWLHKLCREYPNIDRSSIIFDNGTTIFVFDELLPNINENVSQI